MWAAAANELASLPSSLSASRLVAFPASGLTFRGGAPAFTCSSNAEPPLAFLICNADLVVSATLPARIVILVAVFLMEPSFRKSPLRAKAVEARPRITASPTRNTVALPTHITLPATLRIIRSLLSRPGVHPAGCVAAFLNTDLMDRTLGDRLPDGRRVEALVFGELGRVGPVLIRQFSASPVTGPIGRAL